MCSVTLSASPKELILAGTPKRNGQGVEVLFSEFREMNP